MGRKGWFAVFAAAALTGCATEPVPVTEPTGTVQALFVEHLPGVLIERAVAGDPADRPTWVWVRFAEPHDGRAYATAVVDSDTDLAPGDVVRMRLAGFNEGAAQEMRTGHRIVAVVARADRPASPASLASRTDSLTPQAALR